MATETKRNLLDVARAHFARNGFSGTSIAGISNELGMSKQTLLHHFGTKEKLYGEVLKEISDRYVARVFKVQLDHSDPCVQLEELLIAQLGNQFENQSDAQVVMRELMDNQSRAEGARKWYLKPYLEALVAIARRIPCEEDLTPAKALAVIYQLLGAVNYFGMSKPTLTQMFGAKTFDAMSETYPEQLRQLIKARFGP